MMVAEGLIQTCGSPWALRKDLLMDVLRHPSHSIFCFETALLRMSRTLFSSFIFIGIIQESDNDAVRSPAA